MVLRSEAERNRVRRRILRWYALNGRVLPWRGSTDHYRVLVAEIMSHQTRLDRVVQLYPLFLKRFPSFHALARAPRAEVVIAWKGLGYNSRAVRLHLLAQGVVHTHRGRIPGSHEAVRALPGVGPYTVHALMVALHGTDDPVVDVNIRRVLSRIFWRMRTTADLRPEREIWDLAARLVPRGRGYDWSQALMDVGAMICTARAPRCVGCPVAGECASAGRIRPAPRQPSTVEPSVRGIPRRIIRGRVVEALRSGKTGLTLRELGPRVIQDFARKDVGGLARILGGLRRDGLIRLDGKPDRAGTEVRLA